MDTKLTAVDLFCGAGGLSLGFLNAGIEVVGAFDFWDKAIETHLANLPCPAEILDLSDVENSIKTIKPLAPNIIAGGPPCQDFSLLNVHNVETDSDEMTYKRYLTVKFAEIIVAVGPDYFLMENVPPTMKSKAYAMALETFKKGGYALANIIVDASYCHTPQARKRLFCFGAKSGEEAGQVFLESIFERQTPTQMSVKQHFGDDIDFDFYLKCPEFTSRAVYSVHEPSPTITGGHGNVPEKYQGHVNDPADFRDYRILTIEERGRIQTFPKGWKWLKSQSKTDINQQIGNAVPVNLGEFLGTAIIDAHQNKPKQMLLNLV